MYFNRHLWYVREAKLEGREEKKYKYNKCV